MADSQVMMVVGSQWGDEGKGKLVDYLTDKVDVCARCQGGNNAGHTIVVNGVKFDFHLMPSGVVHEKCMNVIGNGCVVHIDSFFEEVDKAEAKGINTTGRIILSDRAHIVFDLHQAIDGLKEVELGKGKVGTTGKGIGPVYSSKASRGGIRVGDLLFDTWKERFQLMVKNKGRRFEGTDFNVNVASEIAKYEGYVERLKPYIGDTVWYINNAFNEGKKILIEGANAIMLDIDFGTYPFVTSSNTGCGGACTGLGLSPNKIQSRFGVVKAYTTRVGSGPFPTEQLNDIGETLQTVGHEYGTTTGRKRRCGWLDLVLLGYSHLINDYSALCVTKLDVLSGFKELKVAVQYILDGKPLPSFPANLENLAKVEVVYETLPGWEEDITGARKFEDLPANAQAYVNKIEEVIGSPVAWIGVGPGREEMIARPLK